MVACAVETCSCFGFAIINVVYRWIKFLLLLITALYPDCKRIRNVVCLNTNIFLSYVFSYASQGYHANSASQCLVTHFLHILWLYHFLILWKLQQKRKENTFFTELTSNSLDQRLLKLFLSQRAPQY
jgi:hypothetical protein